MTTGITIGLRFSDGTIAYLQNDDVTAGAAGEEILTANQGGDLSQTAGVSAGQAYSGKMCTHAFALVQTQNASTARPLWFNFRGPNGAVIVPIHGGILGSATFAQLYKPVMMQTGVVVFGAWQAASDSATLIASVDICGPQKCDNFTATAVDGANTELKNKDGATVGQSMNGAVGVEFWARYAGTLGLNENLGGVSAITIAASDGAMKMLLPLSVSSQGAIPSAVIPVRINQNDSMFVNTDT